MPGARRLPERLLGVVDPTPSERARSDAGLTALIRRIHERSRGTYGVPRVHAELAYEGTRCSRKRVARLMRTAGIEGVHRRRAAHTTVRDRDAAPAPDLVNRVFRVTSPNALWVADITYVPTWQGFLYVAVVVDAFSQRSSAGRWPLLDHGVVGNLRRWSDGHAAHECSTQVTLRALDDVVLNADYPSNEACSLQPVPSQSPGS